MSEKKSLIQQVGEFIQRAEPRFEHAPPGIVFDAEQSFAIQHLTNNERLMDAAKQSPDSLLAAMSNVANMGLSLNPAKAQAYLIPRSVCVGKDDGGRKIYRMKVFLEPSYRGMCDIATGTGCVLWLQADVVREKDKFHLNGMDQQPTHERDPFSTDRGEITGAYCVAKLPNGDFLTTAMSKAELDKVKESSESGKKGFGPWKDWEEEQMKKTTIRRAWKMLPKSKEHDRMAKVIDMSNENEGFEPIVNEPRLTHSPEQKDYFDQLIEKSDAIGMNCFLCSLGESVQTSLFNSFPQGSKGSNKQLVRDLQQRGMNQLIDIETVVSEAMTSNDDMAAKEVLEDLSQEAIEFLCQRNDSDFRAYVNNCLQELAA